MLTKLAYSYYEAGVAVAAIHLKLTLKQVSINPARGGTDVVIARENHKARITLWLAGLAAEKKGVGETDAFRRMRNRRRIDAEIQEEARGRKGKAGAAILGQAQDRANAICSGLFPAIKKLAERLITEEVVPGDQVERIVAEFRKSKLRAPPEI